MRVIIKKAPFGAWYAEQEVYEVDYTLSMEREIEAHGDWIVFKKDASLGYIPREYCVIVSPATEERRPLLEEIDALKATVSRLQNQQWRDQNVLTSAQEGWKILKNALEDNQPTDFDY